MGKQYCPKCGEQLTKQARFCKACGAKLSMAKANTKKRDKTLLLLIIGVALVVAAFLSFTTLTSVTDAAADHNDIPYPDVARATVTEVRTGVDAGSALIVDVRSADAYQASHIADAISMPLEEMGDRYQELPQGQMIFLYCT